MSATPALPGRLAVFTPSLALGSGAAFCAHQSAPKLKLLDSVVFALAAAPEGAQPVPLVALAPGRCGWVLEPGRLCCNQPVGRRRDGRRSIWCQHHHPIAYPAAEALA